MRSENLLGLMRSVSGWAIMREVFSGAGDVLQCAASPLASSTARLRQTEQLAEVVCLKVIFKKEFLTSEATRWHMRRSRNGAQQLEAEPAPRCLGTAAEAMSELGTIAQEPAWCSSSIF